MTSAGDAGGITRAEAALLDEWGALGDELLAEVTGIAAVPAPTFDEGERARHVAERFRAAGHRPAADEAGNVWVRIDGRSPGPLLLVTGHMDTVFSREAHRPPVRRGDRLHGPGVRDNAAAVALLVVLARWWRDRRPDRGSLVLAATVQEEGLGNLNGIRALVERFGGEVGAVVVVDGNLGWLIHAGVGSVRWQVQVEADGGHSWLDAGRPSAVHGLIRGLGACLELPRPADPLVAFNVGTVSGGLSVNAIATRASALLDLRSADAAALAEAARRVEEALVAEVGRAGCRLALEVVGRRPGGTISPDHPFVVLARRSLADLGIAGELRAASTEANVPLSLGIPTVCVGSSVGARMHTPEESLDVSTLVPGLRQVGLVVHRTLAGWDRLGG